MKLTATQFPNNNWSNDRYFLTDITYTNEYHQIYAYGPRIVPRRVTDDRFTHVPGVEFNINIQF